MTPTPRWMRAALFATAAMNLLGALAFVPALPALRAATGFPENVPALYLWIVGEFIFLFGIAYLVCAVRGRADRLLIAIAAAGKLVFFATIALFALTGQLPLRAPAAALGDLVFGVLFLVWLRRPA